MKEITLRETRKTRSFDKMLPFRLKGRPVIEEETNSAEKDGWSPDGPLGSTTNSFNNNGQQVRTTVRYKNLHANGIHH